MKDPVKLKIIFMGTPAFASKLLGSLLEKKYNVISVYTRPDAKSGRKGEQKKSEVKKTAEEKGLKIFEPRVFDQMTIDEIRKQKPDLIVVAAYGKILPKEVLEIPGFGALNAHASLLPLFRGPSPIQNALLAGEKETGTTIMLMDEGVDTGEILNQKKIAINPQEKYPELLEKIAILSAELLPETINLWVNRKISPRRQDPSRASQCQLIERQDGKIIWSDDALSIYNRFRAFYPWPGIFSYWEKNDCNLRLKLNEIELGKEKIDSDCPLGKIFVLDRNICVCAGKGYLILREVQLEGKKSASIKDFINGYPDFLGSVLK
jgi:methionyl-tRNA formyltransferase